MLQYYLSQNVNMYIVQTIISYIFANIFRSECTIPFLLAAEESPLNSAEVMKILL